jgi:hypothetical protein
VRRTAHLFFPAAVQVALRALTFRPFCGIFPVDFTVFEPF